MVVVVQHVQGVQGDEGAAYWVFRVLDTGSLGCSGSWVFRVLGAGCWVLGVQGAGS